MFVSITTRLFVSSAPNTAGFQAQHNLSSQRGQPEETARGKQISLQPRAELSPEPSGSPRGNAPRDGQQQTEGRGAGRLLQRLPSSPGRGGRGSLTGKLPRRRVDRRARSRTAAPARTLTGSAILTAQRSRPPAAVSALLRSPGGSAARSQGSHPSVGEEMGRDGHGSGQR